jgi:predicted SAM-dependent methyltransferase
MKHLTLLEVLRYIKRVALFYGGSLYCNVCNKPLRNFFLFPKSLEAAAKSAGFPYDFREVETLNYEYYNCPFCLSSDRERLYLLFIDNCLQNNKNVFKVLDFAPGFPFVQAMRNRKQLNYTTADFFRSDYDLLVDICNMTNIEDNQFDIVICSHILEHVPSPDGALREIMRILKTGGFAIIMVPLFNGVVSTIEEPRYNTEELRIKHYGQSDHVRLFAKENFIQRIEEAGFDLKMLTEKDFDRKLVKKYAIAENSILYICHKSGLST